MNRPLRRSLTFLGRAAIVTGMAAIIIPMSGLAPLDVSGAAIHDSVAGETPSAAQAFSGNLSGSFNGAATDGSGSYSGSIEGAWNASVTGASVDSLDASGTFGGLGIAGTWEVTNYDPQTRTITIAWSAPGNRGPLSASGTPDGSVTLVLDPTTSLATGNFQGQVYTADGIKTITGTWTVRFQGIPTTVVSGTVQGTFTLTSGPVGAIGGTVTGTWTVRFMPDGSVAGVARGTYDGGTVPVPLLGPVCICGTWLANVIRGSDGQYRFEGSWTHPQAAGTADGRGGGSVVWYINTGTSPIQATGNFQGAVNISLPVPPLMLGGTWNATLPITP